MFIIHIFMIKQYIRVLSCERVKNVHLLCDLATFFQFYREITIKHVTS